MLPISAGASCRAQGHPDSPNIGFVYATFQHEAPSQVQGSTTVPVALAASSPEAGSKPGLYNEPWDPRQDAENLGTPEVC